MNKLFEQFTNEAKAKFSAVFATEEFANFIQKTKAATDSGTFRVIISTPAIDRQGESVDQNLWDLSNYLGNPVVLWAHDYYSLPIGIATNIEKQIIDNQAVLVAEGKFAPAEANPFAQQVRALYESGIVRATSVGFIPSSARMDGLSEKGNELLEFSFVPVPANPQALSLSQAQKLGLDLSLLATKGIIFEEKTKAEEPQDGDACKLEDGSEGVLEEDGNGDLVCVPKPQEKKEPENAEEEEKSLKAGRTLSKTSREQIQNAIDALNTTVAALEKLLDATDSQGGEGEDDSGDGSSLKQRSTPVGSQETFDFDDWRFSREVLRAIVTSGSEALERFNKAAREQASRK